MSRVDLLAVRPHPDDESSGTGAMLARYSRQGFRVGVATCTGGEEGEIHDPNLDPEEARPRLHQLREDELRAACQLLGVSAVRLLGYRDSGMPETPANQRADAFCNVALSDSAAALATVIRELRPRVVVTENEHGTYGHPDHIRCHQVTVEGIRLAPDPTCPGGGFASWKVERLYTLATVRDGCADLARAMDVAGLDASFFRSRARPGPPWFPISAAEADAAIDVADFLDVQREALLQHRTQLPIDGWIRRMPVEVARTAFATTYLQRLIPPPDGRRETDILVIDSPKSVAEPRPPKSSRSPAVATP